MFIKICRCDISNMILTFINIKKMNFVRKCDFRGVKLAFWQMACIILRNFNDAAIPHACVQPIFFFIFMKLTTKLIYIAISKSLANIIEPIRPLLFFHLFQKSDLMVKIDPPPQYLIGHHGKTTRARDLKLGFFSNGYRYNI